MSPNATQETGKRDGIGGKGKGINRFKHSTNTLFLLHNYNVIVIPSISQGQEITPHRLCDSVEYMHAFKISTSSNEGIFANKIFSL